MFVNKRLSGKLAADDRPGAIAGYQSALRLGNTQPLPELFRAAGAHFPFSNKSVEQAVDFVFDEWSTIIGI